MAAKFEIITPYKNDSAICIKLEPDPHSFNDLLTISRKTSDSTQALVSFTAHLMNVHQMSERSILSICDSHSEACGEIAFQMFDPAVYRDPYPYGKVYMCEYSNLTGDGEQILKEDPEFLQQAMKSFFAECVKRQRKPTIVYFAYFGISDVYVENEETLAELEQDQKLLAIFKAVKFTVFRCVEPLASFDDDYIAICSSAVVDDPNAWDAQASVEEYPEPREDEDYDDEDEGEDED